METTEFLTRIFNRGETINFRMIAGEAVANEFVIADENLPGEIERILAEYQPQYCCYFGVNPRQGNNTKVVSRITCVFVDIDAKDFPSEEEYCAHCNTLKDHLLKIGLYPSAVVESGHGVHLYWFLRSTASPKLGIDEAGQQTCKAWRELQKALIHFCKGDPSLHDLPRILRLPGSLNTKDQANLKHCRVVSCTDRRYSLRDFNFVLGQYRDHQKEIEQAEKAAIKEYKKKAKRVGESASGELKDIVLSVLASSPGVADSYDDFLRLAMAFKSAGLSYDEVDPVFAASAGYNPDRNRKIYERLVPRNIGIGTAYHYAKRSNPQLLEEKLRNGNGRPAPARDLPPPERQVKRPIIHVAGGDLPWMVDQAEKVLVDTGKLYQRCGMVVKVVKTGTVSGIRRDQLPTIRPVEPANLTETLTRLVRWDKYDMRREEYKPVDCPKAVAESLLTRGEWNLPELAGIIDIPTLRSDGSILDTSGYDDKTGLLLIGKNMPRIPDRPSRQDALQALSVIKDLIKNFPFVSSTDRSVAIAAILTAPVRRSIYSAPMFAVSAPKMATGKTLLGDIPAIIATGTVATKISQAKSPEEEEKRLLAVLMEGDPVICLDNIEQPLESDKLCTILTEPGWKSRLLQFNRMVSVSTAVTWIATGNNLRLKGDLSSRSLLCRLDAKCERPEARKFDENLRHVVLRNRGKLVKAVLLILRAYYVAGRPQQVAEQFGRYEEWSDLVRSSLLWLGEPDPCESRHVIEEDDPDREDLYSLLLAWYKAFGSDKKTTNEVRKFVEEGLGNTEKRENLKSALLAVSMKSGEVNEKRLGYYLRKKRGRPEGWLKFKGGKKSKHGVMWHVVPDISDESVEKAKEILLADGGKYNDSDVVSRLSIPEVVLDEFWKKVYGPDGRR